MMRAQLLHLHSRLTRPLLNILGIFLVIPLVVRKESRSLVTSIALCMAALALIVGLAEVFQFIGKAALMRTGTGRLAPPDDRRRTRRLGLPPRADVRVECWDDGARCLVEFENGPI